MNTLEQQLSEYLADRQREKAEGITLRTLANAQIAHEQKCDERWRLNDDKHRSMRVRIEGQEARIDAINQAEHTTGNHLIKLAKDIGEVKGRRASLPPVLRIINWIGSSLIKEKGFAIALFLVGGTLDYVAHLLHWLK